MCIRDSATRVNDTIIDSTISTLSIIIIINNTVIIIGDARKPVTHRLIRNGVVMRERGDSVWLTGRMKFSPFRQVDHAVNMSKVQCIFPVDEQCTVNLEKGVNYGALNALM